MAITGVFVTKLWPVQALACGGGTKNIIIIYGNFINNNICHLLTCLNASRDLTTRRLLF